VDDEPPNGEAFFENGDCEDEGFPTSNGFADVVPNFGAAGAFAVVPKGFFGAALAMGG
jgi:hypothetical protein